MAALWIHLDQGGLARALAGAIGGPDVEAARPAARRAPRPDSASPVHTHPGLVLCRLILTFGRVYKLGTAKLGQLEIANRA